MYVDHPVMPTRDELDKPPTKRRILLALVVAGTILVAAIRWWTVNGASLANPTTANVSNGFFGPNFQTVPEPATGLLALGGAAVLLARRRRAALSRRLAQTPL